ncbi:MAG: hypothetical protein QOG10_5146 [Kribbellaceae bacterium]|jgi:hypothetical protein|nr:hypothetical protein [Kribbellaceae bacterium]
MRTGRASTTNSRVIMIIVLVWLLIGLAAATQRHYFSTGPDATCAKVGTTLVTIVAGPLNYIGANPKVNCAAPQPSK